jgi:Holliday junction resolvase
VNTKSKGNRQERRCRDWLKTYGFKSCKAGASLGTWDLISVNKDAVLLVQVKSNRWPRSKEMVEMQEFDAPWGAHKLVVRYDDGVKAPKVKQWLRASDVWIQISPDALSDIATLTMDLTLDHTIIDIVAGLPGSPDFTRITE